MLTAKLAVAKMKVSDQCMEQWLLPHDYNQWGIKELIGNIATRKCIFCSAFEVVTTGQNSSLRVNSSLDLYCTVTSNVEV